MTEQEILGQIAMLQARLEEIRAENIRKNRAEPSEEAKAKAKELNPIDDIFFNKMGESPEVCNIPMVCWKFISAILQFPVRVLQVIPQNTITSLQGC